MSAGALLATVLRGSGAVGFTPLSLGSSLVGWWRKGIGRYESADESDPADTNGNAIRRWSDQSGVGNHLLQATANIRPARYDDYVSCFWKTDGADLQAILPVTLASSLSRRSLSGGWVGDAPCNNAGVLLDFGPSGDNCGFMSAWQTTNPHNVWLHNGAAVVDTGLVASGRRMTIVWSASASGISVWVNGVKATLTALGDTSVTTFRIGSFSGGSPKPSRCLEMFLASRAMTDAEAVGASDYLRGLAGALGASGTVVTVGDSLSMGCGSDLGLPWMYHPSLTNRATSHTWRCLNADGATIWTGGDQVTAALVASLVSSSADVVVVWMGTNDIITHARTGAQVFTDLESYRTAVQATGAKFIAATLQKFATNDAERVNFNNALVAAAGYDAKVLLHAAPELDDSTDTTYYTDDGVHLKDAGHAAAAALFQTAMASV